VFPNCRIGCSSGSSGNDCGGSDKCRKVSKLLVSLVGHYLDPEQIAPFPSNTIIVKRAPLLELLKHASVCITHAGLNTVLEALAQGVPQVAIPVTNDQPGVAAGIANKKTGLFVPLNALSLADMCQSGGRLRQFGQKRVGLSKNSVYWREF
jgi:UDP:flavonoid glycosyltransferase YjiC (YdhE family)